MKFTSQLLAAASGSLGGTTAAHNAGGQYLRRRAIPVNPQTGYQTNVRNAMGAAADRWTTALTEAQREAWRTWAAGITVQNTLGQSIKLSGFQHYVRINQLALYSAGATTTLGGFAITDTAPSGTVIGPSSQIVAAGITRTAGPPAVVTLAVDLQDVPVDGAVAVWLSPPVGVGKHFWKGPYILVDVRDDTAAFSVNLNATATPEYKTRFGLPAVGAKLWGYVRLQSPDGRIGPRLNFGPFIAA